MNICLLMITDGRRECLTRTLLSLDHLVDYELAFQHWLMIDDSADRGYADWLDRTYGQTFQIVHHAERRGFGGAVQSGWDHLPVCDFVFHLEDDFVFRSAVRLDLLVALLEHAPYLAQVVLKRTPVNAEERAVGGFIEQHPDEYTEQAWGGLYWTEHARNFSTNPCLIPYAVTRLGFQTGERDNERRFGEKLKGYGYRFAYWGKKFDPPVVEHIGVNRVGTGY